MFNDTLNTFYLKLFNVGNMVHMSENTPQPFHGLLLWISSKGYFVCTNLWRTQKSLFLHGGPKAANVLSWNVGKEGNILFNDALNTFYFRLYGVRHMVKDHSDSERGNPLPPHGLLFSIKRKGSFRCTIPQTG